MKSSVPFQVWKDGGVVEALFRGSQSYKKADTHEPVDRARVFAVDTESLVCSSELRTLLVPVHFYNRGVCIETPDGTGCLEKLFDEIFAQPGYAEEEDRASRKSQRAPNSRGHRPGRREATEPVLSVWFNLPYDIGRLLSGESSRHSLRAIASGAESYRVRVGRYELEVVRMHFGSSSSFEWYVRREEGDEPRASKTLVVRMLGLDLTGYWKVSLANAGKAAGVAAKIDIEEAIEDVYEKSRESFTAEEWRLFRAYGLGDVKTTLELYHRTVELLVGVDARVIRKTGLIPPSAPGASARVLFAKAFDCHPEIEEWSRYAPWADQLGLNSYFGGRAFCVSPGIYSRMGTLDLKSAYPFQMALMPDPVGVVIQAVDAKVYEEGEKRVLGLTGGALSEGQRRFVEDFRGKHGVLCVRGEAFDDVVPAFRIHDPDQSGRLRYVAGPFDDVPVTIPELVIGVLRGAIRIDAIVSSASRSSAGVLLLGAPEKSFLREGVKAFFSIKEDTNNEQALRDMAKLLMNSAYGKLIEVKRGEFLVDAGDLLMRSFVKKREVTATLARIFASFTPIGREERVDPPGGSFRSLRPLQSDPRPSARSERLNLDLRDTYWGDDEEQKEKSRGLFQARVKACETPLEAVSIYVESLEFAGAPARGENLLKIREYVRGTKRYDCGHYFMPLYAAQITGATSAMVGLMADVLGALQGDTDSVHVVIPEGCARIGDDARKERYFEIMAQAGYASPRLVPSREGLGSQTPLPLTLEGGIPGLGRIGIWEEECPEPSDESVLVRPKLYSHRFPSKSRAEGAPPVPCAVSKKYKGPRCSICERMGLTDHEPSYKQARHGFARFDSDEARNVKSGKGTREERSRHEFYERQRSLHEAMKTLLATKSYSYDARRAPRRLREAIVHDLTVGEFTSRPMCMSLRPDPNTWIDAAGFVRWRKLGEKPEEVKAAE